MPTATRRDETTDPYDEYGIAEAVREISDEATDYLQSVTAEGATWIWDAGELALGQRRRDRRLRGREQAMTSDCVGFADCPCFKCAALRLQITESHPNHDHISDRSYCGACRTAVTLSNYVRTGETK